MNYLKEYRFQYKQKCSASIIFAIATFFLALIASSCSQQTAINAAANSDSSSKTLTTKTKEKNNVIRLGYQKGAILIHVMGNDTATICDIIIILNKRVCGLYALDIPMYL